MRESCATSCSWAGTLLFVSGFTGLFRSLIFWNMFRYVYVSNIGSVKNVESEKKTYLKMKMTAVQTEYLMTAPEKAVKTAGNHLC